MRDEVATFHYARDVGDGWVLVLHFASNNDVAHLVEYSVVYDPATDNLDDLLSRRVDALQPPVSPPRAPMTARRRRALPFSEVEAAARLSIRRGFGAFGLPEGWSKRRPSYARGGSEPVLSDAALASLAVEYSQIEGPKPVKQLAAKHNLSTATIRNRLAVARSRGLLSSAGQGRVGGRPTVKAWEVLSHGVD